MGRGALGAARAGPEGTGRHLVCLIDTSSGDKQSRVSTPTRGRARDYN